MMLVGALQATGARIAWSAGPRVTASARTDARPQGGFGDILLAMVVAFADRADNERSMAGYQERLLPIANDPRRGLVRPSHE